MRKILMLMLGVFALCTQLWAQRTITGTVTDQNGAPLSNVSIQVKGTSSGTVSGDDGTFSLNVPANARTLVFSTVGMASREITIGNQSTFSVTLQSADQNLQEVVVVGYGTARRRTLTGSVASVSGKEVQNIPIASIDQILQGKAPGVQITAVNGRPGANAYVRIRGTGSVNAGSQPLYVIDGIPAPNGDILNTINPNDIENISVLKDAASSAIYGSRAANGVILVTTKKGRANRPQLTYRFNYGQVAKTDDNFRMMNSREKIQYEYNIGKEFNSFVGSGSRGNAYAQSAIATLVAAGKLPTGTNNIYNLNQDQLNQVIDQVIATNGDNNWQDILLRKGQIMQHEVNLSGGTDKLRYFSSLQQYNEEGIGLRSTFKRTGGRINIDYTATDWLKVGNNINVTYTNDRLLRDRYNAQSPFYAMYAYNPYEPPYIPGTSNYNLTGFAAGFPILEAIETNTEDTRQVLGVTNLFADLNLIKNLTVRTNLGLNFSNYERESFIIPGSFLDQVVGDPAAPGSKTDNGNRNFNYVWTNTANYITKFAENHNINLLAGTEFTRNKFRSYSVSAKGFASPNTTTLNAAAANTAFSTAQNDWAIYSLFGNAQYDFMNKYFLTGSVRRDGSSRFSDQFKYANFWSVGAGWNIASEPFMDALNIFNTLKLRGSVGTTGNFNIGNYPFQELYGVASYGDLIGTRPIQVRNDSLTWEKALLSNIGLDFELMKGRLSGSVEYYHRTTKDLLLNVPYSQTNGFGNRLENVGEVVNLGVEAALSYAVIQKRDISWTLRGNTTRNKNRVTKLYGGKDIPVTTARLSEGKPFYNYYMVRWAGVDPATGNPQYFDKDGKVTSTFSTGDAVFLENKQPDPKYFGTIGTDVNFKGFTLTADLYYSGGNYIVNYMERDRLNGYGNRALNLDVRAFDYWKKPGDNAMLPRPAATTVQQTTDQWLQKGDFVRLRNLQLGYAIPATVTNRFKVQSLRLYVSGQNLWTKTAYKGDPEVGLGSGESFDVVPGLGALYSYPPVRRLSFGLDITF